MIIIIAMTNDRHQMSIKFRVWTGLKTSHDAADLWEVRNALSHLFRLSRHLRTSSLSFACRIIYGILVLNHFDSVRQNLMQKAADVARKIEFLLVHWKVSGSS